MGYEAIPGVQELSSRPEAATALIPDELVDDMHIIGDAGRSRSGAWEDGVTTLMLSCRGGRGARRTTIADHARLGERDVRRRPRAAAPSDDGSRAALQHRPEDLEPHHLRRVSAEFLRPRASATTSPPHRLAPGSARDRWCVRPYWPAATPRRGTRRAAATNRACDWLDVLRDVVGAAT